MAIKFSLPLSRMIARPAKRLDAAKPSRLLACAECLRAVSPQATICPHCHLSPRRKRCAICCKDDKQSNLVNYTHATVRGGSTSATGGGNGGRSATSRSMPDGGGGGAGRGGTRYERYSRARGGNRFTAQSSPAPPPTAGEATPFEKPAPELEQVATDDGTPPENVSEEVPPTEEDATGDPSDAARASSVHGASATTGPTAGGRVGAAGAFAHDRCLKAVQNTPQQYLCPDCGLVRSLLIQDGFPTCPGCGLDVARTNCRSCGKPLWRAPAFRFAFFTQRENERVEGFFHPQCSAGIEKRGEELMRRRKEKKRCTMCGNDLNFVRALFSDRHADCDVLRYESREPWRVE